MIESFRMLFAPPRNLLLLVAAAWIGLLLSERRAERRGLSKDDLNNLMFFALLAFTLGGRVSYVVQNLASFRSSPLDAFSINPDLFDAFGAAVVAVLTLAIYIQRRSLSVWSAADALTPAFAVIAIGVGLSDLAAGAAFGRPTTLPWGIDLWNAHRHPTQIYEALAAGVTFCLIWLKRPNPRPGMDFLLFAALTAAAQILIGGFRADSALVLSGVHQVQLAWTALLLFTFVATEYRIRAKLVPAARAPAPKKVSRKK